jgi:hypothetical protein
VRAFTAELERESEAERAAAELVVWDDCESASESDSDGVGSLVLFPSSDGSGFRG